MQILKQVTEKNHALSAGTNLKPNPGQLNEVLKQVGIQARHDCLICLISDVDGIDGETRRHVTRIAEHNDVLTAFIYDPLEKSMPPAGRLRFTDGSGQLEADTSEKNLRADFQSEFEQKMERIENSARRFSIPVLALDTVRPVADQLRDAFGHQQGARRY